MVSVTAQLIATPAARDVDDVTGQLGADPEHGLTAAEVAVRQQQYGPNELRSRPPTPLWQRVVQQFRDPLVYLLLVAIGISTLVWILEGARGAPVDALVILVILVANAAIGFVQQARAADAVAALARMTEVNSTVIRDGARCSVPSRDLVPGDVLCLSEGDAVGADARIVTATALKVHEAALTGESEAVVKDPAPVAVQAPVGDRTSMVHKGTAVVEGVGRAVVTATGMRTEMGAIAELLDTTERQPSPLEAQLDKVSRSLGLIVVGIAVVVMTALFGITRPEQAEEYVTILLMGVSLAVAAVPEGLVAILSLVLALGVRAMAQRNAVLKDLHSVETLGSASVICTDKTGTLTRNEMTLRTIVTASGVVELDGTGYAPDGAMTVVNGEPADTLAEAQAVLIAGAVANNAQLSEDDGRWQAHGDPTEVAFLAAEYKLPGIVERVSHYQRHAEIPFTSDRKMMSVRGHDDDRDEDRVYAKGAPDVILERCRTQRVGVAVRPLDEAARAAVLTGIEQLADQGYRTLGVAYRVMTDDPGAMTEDPGGDRRRWEQDLTYVGTVGIIDPPRDEVSPAVAQARRAGIRPIMITGDHPATARRIGADLGITTDTGRALTGTQLDELDPASFCGAIAEVNVFARVAPHHKLQIVEELQADGQIVAMTGDGVNDAPALKSADIGVAMGITGTEVSKDAATMILGDDNFATIVAAVRQGRVIFANIGKFLRYLLSSNMGEVATVFFGVVLAGVLGLTDAHGELILPLLATQILWINLVTDSAPALAMGVDPELDDVMASPPRRRTDPILDRAAWIRIGWVGLVMGAAVLLTIDRYLPGGLLDGSADVETARTAGFTTLVLAQLMNAFCARSARRSAFQHLFANRWLWAAAGLGLGLQIAVVHVGWLQAAFGTTSLSPSQWLVSVAMASLVLWTQEVVKLVQRHW